MLRVYTGDVSSLENGKLFERFYDIVSAERQKKIDALRFDSDRRLSLGAELLLKKATEDAGYRYQTLHKSLSEKGKPFFDNLPGFCFNLSHSGTMAMCAVSDRDTGCDVEKITGSNLKIAKRFSFTISSNMSFSSSGKHLKNMLTQTV